MITTRFEGINYRQYTNKVQSTLLDCYHAYYQKPSLDGHSFSAATVSAESGFTADRKK